MINSGFFKHSFENQSFGEHMATVLLIDGHSQAYRAFFGVKAPLTTQSGEPTGAVFGFVRKIFNILKEYTPDYIAVAFDTGDTWRHAEFKPYKATRDSMPDEMRTQMTRIEQFLDAYDIPVVTYPNYEADDVLGTLSEQAARAGNDVLILTGDRDMFQLVTDRINILYTSGGPNPKTIVYGLEEIKDRYDLHPDQFVDLKALTGDSSDNIPGVAGVGEKTAIKFLQQYGSVDNLYAHVDEIRGPKTRQNLVDAKDQVALNQHLMKIVTDLDLVFDAEACRVGGFDPQAVREFFMELNFRSLLRELPQTEDEAETSSPDSGQMSLFMSEAAGTAGDGAIPADGDYFIVQDEESLQRLVRGLSSAQCISFDVETTSADASQAKLVGLGITWTAQEAAYIPVAHSEGNQLPWRDVRSAIQPYFSDPTIAKLAHNGKYDLTVCRRHGLDIRGQIHDTMIMAWLLNPASRSLGLKAQAAMELGWQMTELADLIGNGRKQITMDLVSINQVAAYCGADVDATIQLYDILEDRLKSAGMWNLYADIELPLLPVLTDMEMAGILLDTDYLLVMSANLTQRLSELETDLYKIVGREFNLRSTQQLSNILFDDLAFPSKGLKRTSSGHISTAASTLERLAEKADELSSDQKRVLDIILEQRQLEKLRGTYVDALPTLVNEDTGRLHTNFNQVGAVTGRMSSNNPNLQNIPIRTELGREIRRAFVAPAGWRLISADYSQVELRVLAHIAKEEALIESFRADQDIHAATASRLFGVPIESVDRSQRGLAKTINFATIYGVSEFGLSTRTEMSRMEAREFLGHYFEMYPRIREYIDSTIQRAKEEGHVDTLLGRKRFFPELQNRGLPYNQRQSVERAAINAPIQGTAADIMKLAMIDLHRQLKQANYQARMLLQVHDELVLEVPLEELAEVVNLVRLAMEGAYELIVPLKVDVEVGPNWYNMDPV